MWWTDVRVQYLCPASQLHRDGRDHGENTIPSSLAHSKGTELCSCLPCTGVCRQTVGCEDEGVLPVALEYGYVAFAVEAFCAFSQGRRLWKVSEPLQSPPPPIQNHPARPHQPGPMCPPLRERHQFSTRECGPVTDPWRLPPQRG